MVKFIKNVRRILDSEFKIIVCISGEKHIFDIEN